MATCLVSLGSNLGDRRQRIEQAIARIDAHGLIQVTARSRLYETQPIGGPAGQGSFVNAAIRLETSLPPLSLLRILHETETQLGRTRGERWAARTIDLDLLLYDSVAMSSDELTLPHPRMAFRRFVLEPAAEIAAESRVPPLGLTVEQLRERVVSPPNFVALAGPRKTTYAVATRVVRVLNDQYEVPAQFVTDPVADEELSQFNASSAGPDFDTAIEFLWRRTETLGAATWPDPETWVVSDFVFGPATVLGTARMPPTRFSELRSAYEDAVSRIVHPKLVCSLGDRRETLTPEERKSLALEWLRRSESMTPDELESLMPEVEKVMATATAEISEMASRRCPTLTLHAANEDRAVGELTAAVLAMHDEPHLLS